VDTLPPSKLIFAGHTVCILEALTTRYEYNVKGIKKMEPVSHNYYGTLHNNLKSFNFSFLSYICISSQTTCGFWPRYASERCAQPSPRHVMLGEDFRVQITIQRYILTFVLALTRPCSVFTFTFLCCATVPLNYLASLCSAHGAKV